MLHCTTLLLDAQLDLPSLRVPGRHSSRFKTLSWHPSGGTNFAVCISELLSVLNDLWPTTLPST